MMRRVSLISFALYLVCGIYSSASASLVVEFAQSGPDVTISVSGDGVVPNGVGTPGTELGFTNFNGNPFSGLVDETFNLTGSLSVTGTESDMMTPYTSTINSIRLVNNGADAADLYLFGDTSIGQRYTYLFSGTAVVQGLTLAELTAGNYMAAGGSGGAGEDTDAFGPVSMSIVPEPASLAMMGLAAMGLCAGGVHRRRKSLRRSTSDESTLVA